MCTLFTIRLWKDEINDNKCMHRVSYCHTKTHALLNELGTFDFGTINVMGFSVLITRKSKET